MQWLSATRAAKRLEICRRNLTRIALASGIRTRLMPGETHPRYSAEDIERVAHESISVAGREPGQAVAS